MKIWVSLFYLVLSCVGSAKVPDYTFLQQVSVEMLVDGNLAGTGVIVKEDGTLLSAAHVIRGPAAKLEIRSDTLGRHPVEVLNLDYGHDLALLRIKHPLKNLKTAKLAVRPPKPGEDVFLLGAAFYRHDVLIRGAVGREKPAVEYLDGHFTYMIHVTAPSPGGVSGGGWFNAAGELVFIQSGNITVNGAPQGISMAAPLVSLKSLLAAEELIHTATLYMAVEELWGQSSQFIGAFNYDKPALVIRQVKKGRAAHIAGIRDLDMLIEMDGRSYERIDGFLKALRGKNEGDTMTLKVVNKEGKDPRSFEVTVESLEARWRGKLAER